MFIGTPTSAEAVVINLTTVNGGTPTYVLKVNSDNTIGQYSITGTGTVVAMQTSPSFIGTVSISGATTTGPDVEVSMTGDTNARVAIGLNTTDVPRLSFGPGNAVRDTFIERAGAANFRLGSIAVDTAPVAQTLSVQNTLAGGTSNVAGANFTIAGSQGKGTGVGGTIVFRTSRAGSTGTAVNALADTFLIGGNGNFSNNAAPNDNIKFRLTGIGTATNQIMYMEDGSGNVSLQVLDNGSNILGRTAPATNVTAGFVYIPAMAGQPVGTPTAQTGFVPIQYDTTNHQFWVYDGGAWKQPKTPAAAAIITWQ